MKSKFSKTMTSLLLIAALVFSGLSYQGKKAAAATDQTTIFSASDFSNLTDETPLAAGTPATHTFNVSSNGTISILVYTPNKIAMTLKITNASGKEIYNDTILSTDPYWYTTELSEGVTVYYNGITWKQPTSDSYTLSLTFDQDTYFMAAAVQGPAVQTPAPPTQQPVKTPTPSLNAQSVTLTAGFSQTISAYNTNGAVTWSSGNASIATVSNGKITGKKPGKTTISAKTANGYTMTCSVTVKKNEYSVKKLSVKKVTYGKSGIDIYKVSYDKKGNLVLKTRVLNNSSYKLKELRNVKIKIKDNNGKLIGAYSAKKIKKVNLKAGKAKAYTFKIKKSKLKNKKANLPLLSTSVSGRAYYIR